jgi:hypothetical protein
METETEMEDMAEAIHILKLEEDLVDSLEVQEVEMVRQEEW